LDEMFMQTKEFSIQTHSTFNFIAHPRSQHDPKEKNGSFKVITQHMLAGGAAFDNNMDGIYSIDRPGSHLNPNDPQVSFYNLKQRKAHLVAKRGVCDTIRFDFLKNRYYFSDICPIDGSVAKGKETSVQQEIKPLHDVNKQPDAMPF
jgi:hypothetical protein